MKKYIRIVLIVALAAGTQSQSLAQNFQGIATYKTKTSGSVTLPENSPFKGMQEEMQKKLNEMLQRDYELRFNVKESLWSRVESLTGPGSNAAMVMDASTGSSLFYKNAQDGNYEQETNLLGKAFLVKDKLQRYNWELTGETKQIGEYTCQKATYSFTRKYPQFNLENEEAERDSVERTITVTAWYAPEIPVSHGPDKYWGLPGLILELNDGRSTMVCSKIILNPSEEVQLTRPRKGKVIDFAEFRALRNEKMAEMRKKYSGNQNSNLGTISIGG